MDALGKLVAMTGPDRHIFLHSSYGKWSINYSLNEYGSKRDLPQLKLTSDNHATPEAAICAMFDALNQAAKGFPEVAPMMLTHQPEPEREFDRQENHQEQYGDMDETHYEAAADSVEPL